MQLFSISQCNSEDRCLKLALNGQYWRFVVYPKWLSREWQAKKKKTVLYGAFSGLNGISCKVHKQNTWV